MPATQSAALPAEETPIPSDIAAVRAEIDRIDDALLDLMEQRLARSFAIAALKRNTTSTHINLRPDREQVVIDRVVAHADRLPAQAVATIWRALMAVSLEAQKPMEIVLHTAQQPVAVTDQARLRFGCSARLIAAGSPAEALERARTREAIAIVELTPLSDWWVTLHGDPELAIFDCLHDARGHVSALAVARIAADHMRPTIYFDIMEEEALRRRIDTGEELQPLAMSGNMRLCVRHSELGQGDA